MKPTETELDKYSQYKVTGFHGMDPCDTEDKDCVERHRDQVLEKICDEHPSAPMCNVFDD